MGASQSKKYQVRPFNSGKPGSMSPEASSSSAVISMLASSVTTTKKTQLKRQGMGLGRHTLTNEMAEDVKRTEEEVRHKLSHHWLNSIAAEPVYKLFKDPEQMLLTLPQRLQLENTTNAAYMDALEKANEGARPAPYWSIEFTDRRLLECAEGELDVEWDGPKTRRENLEELARHEGGALRTENYFLSRPQRRELELQVELGFKREKPHVRMPQLSLKYTDKTLLELANTMDGILFTGPSKPPVGLQGEEGGAEGGGAARSGPVSQASFELFIEPIIHEYFRALPAMGAVVTLVKEGNSGEAEIFYTQGFGINGRVDKLAKQELAAKKKA
eukprot:SAG22_NODE_2538_length_2464_cov_1.120930_2_plen_329_part_01